MEEYELGNRQNYLLLLNYAVSLVKDIKVEVSKLSYTFCVYLHKCFPIPLLPCSMEPTPNHGRQHHINCQIDIFMAFVFFKHFDILSPMKKVGL